jgi:hypothetical protein
MELHSICIILELFGHVSWLHTNFAKCLVSRMNCSEEQANGAVVAMECQLAPFPMNYPWHPALSQMAAR